MKILAFIFGLGGIVIFSFVRFILPAAYIGTVNAVALLLSWVIAVIALLTIYKYPGNSKNLFIISVTLTASVVFLYKYFGMGAPVAWDEFIFAWTALLISSACFLAASWLLWRGNSYL